MSEPVISREAIAVQADHAARVAARTGRPQENPYPPGSDAATLWHIAYCRYLLLHSAPEGEASA